MKAQRIPSLPHRVRRLTLAALLALPLVPATALAATVQSENFNFYYDFSGGAPSSGTWKLVAGPGGTPGTIGDFSITSAFINNNYSGYGAVYQNGVLVNGGASDGSVGTARSILADGTTPGFGMTLTGSYNGTPGDATATPDYQISFVITHLSIYGITQHATTPGLLRNFAFEETTAGNTGVSTPIVLSTFVANPGNVVPAANYSLLEWNPGDFETSGVSQQRSFKIAGSDSFGLQGINVQGYMVVNYEAIPEPGTVALLALSAGGLFVARLRRSAKR